MTAAREWWDDGKPEPRPKGRRGLPPRPVAERFWEKVDKSGGVNACWPFMGAPQSGGYGAFRVGDSIELAHRVAYVLTHGPIEADLYVLHSLRCTTKLCCNGRHLRQGTQQDNMDDFYQLVQRKQRKQSKALAVA
jgi:hypothetical protein